MKIEVKRTVSHFFNDNSESVIEIGVFTFLDGEKALRLTHPEYSNGILVNSLEQAEMLCKHIMNTAKEIFE